MSPTRVRPGLVVLAVALLGAAMRLWAGLVDQGIYWPDEIYQSLEPAHALVFHYGLMPWEYVKGARSWAFPGLLAGVFEAARLVGLAEPRQYLVVFRVLFSLVAFGTTLGVYRLARSYDARPLLAAAFAAFFALGAPVAYFGHRALSETASALPLVFGLALVLDPRSSRRALVLGASLLGLSVLLRLQCAVFAAGVLVLLAGKSRRSALPPVSATLAVWALAYGLLDLFTWGSPFHSVVEYLRFNLVEGRASGWGTEAFGYYVRTLLTGMPAIAALTFVLSLLSARRAPGLLAIAAAFFFLHELVGHKELRFILPVLPVLFALAAVGATQALGWLPALGARAEDERVVGWAAVAVLFVALQSAAGFYRLTWRDLGHPGAPRASAWDEFGDVNRLLLAAHDRKDLCGLKIEAVHLAWTGGATYLHRDVPMYWNREPARSSGLFNYVITPIGMALGGEVVARDGRMKLVRIGTKCRKNPNYRWLLP